MAVNWLSYHRNEQIRFWCHQGLTEALISGLIEMKTFCLAIQVEIGHLTCSESHITYVEAKCRNQI